MDRGCGKRHPGGIYLRTILSSRGSRPEDFLFDPPVPAPEEMMIPNRGVLILERPGHPGIHDVYDRIGVESYPNVPDWYTEFCRMGLSRRIKRDGRLELLTPQSRIFLVHPRAIIVNAEEYYEALINEADQYDFSHDFTCRCGKDIHDNYPWGKANPDTGETLPRSMCVSLWWDDIIKGEVNYDPDKPPRTVDRNVGDIWYEGRKRPDKVKPEYQEGIFMWLPLHRLDIINDPEQGEHEKSIEQAERSGLPFRLQDS